MTHSHCLKFIVLVVALLSYSAQSSARLCQQLFIKNPLNLTKELALLEKEGNSYSFHQSRRGDWVEVRGQQIRYRVIGEKGPLRVHFFGLGGQLTRSFADNLVLKEHSKTGRVLIIELPGQGLTEVLRVRGMKQDGTAGGEARIIDFESNVSISGDALAKVLWRLGEDISQVKVWSGNSFGGLNLAGLQARHGHPPSLAQFFASAITAPENRFVSKEANAKLERKRQSVNNFFQMGTSIALQIVKEVLKTQKIVTKEDKIALNGATGQYYGAKQTDAVELAKNFTPGSKVQVFTAEKDTVVFPMMHYEFVSALKKRGIETTAVFVKDTNHNITKSMTLEQRDIIKKMTNNPEGFSGFYVLEANGNLRKIDHDTALKRYKKLSRSVWEKYKKPLQVAFGFLRVKVTYPESWKEVRND